MPKCGISIFSPYCKTFLPLFAVLGLCSTPLKTFREYWASTLKGMFCCHVQLLSLLLCSNGKQHTVMLVFTFRAFCRSGPISKTPTLTADVSGSPGSAESPGVLPMLNALNQWLARHRVQGATSSRAQGVFVLRLAGGSFLFSSGVFVFSVTTFFIWP